MSKEFLELSPIIDENKIKVYEDAFKYVLNNKEIKNIAISGIYGSGKSTICNSYFETQKEIDQDKIIYVALGSYDKDESKNNQNNENRIEKQIINQILFQVKSSKIPLSNYQIKETKHSKIILKTIFTSLFTLLVFLWLLFFINNKNYDIDKWQSITFISVMATSTFIFSFILMFLIFRNYQFKFSQIKFNKYLKMEDKNNLNNNETTLDKEMKELVYILKYSGVKVVIFEDLDRFDMIEIFTKLKELNFCLNKAKEEDKNKEKVKDTNKDTNKDKSENKDNENIVKFFYLIKDSLFSEPEERTKFFDFIIPVVPYVNSNNSFQKLEEFLNQVLNKEQILNQKFLWSISLYINDMRLLKNIVNEYKIYLKNIKNTDNNLLNWNNESLFAILLVKNFFPKEYDDLLKNRGIIFKTIKQISNSTKTIEHSYRNKIEDSKKEIRELELMIENDLFDILALNIDKNKITKILGNYYNGTLPKILKDWSNKENIKVDGETFDQFAEKMLSENNILKTQIDKEYKTKYEKIKELNSKIEKLNLKIKKLSILSFKEKIKEMDSKEINNILFDEYDKNYGLIRMLILENYINDNYFSYIGYFRQGELSKGDITFLKNLKENENNKPDESLDNINLIYDCLLNDDDYLRFNILNADLIKFTIKKKSFERISNLLKMVDEKKEVQNIFYDIVNSLDKEYIENFFVIIKNNLSDFIELIQKDKHFLNSFLIWVYSDITNSEIWDEYKILIENSSFVLENLNDLEFEKLVNNLKTLDVKFMSLKDLDINKNILKRIEANKLFELNLENLKYLLINLDENINFSYEKMISLIFDSDKFSSTQEYLDENGEDFIDEYISTIIEKKLSFNNNEKETIEILNSNISDELKNNYVYNNETLISDIEKIDSDDIKLELLKKYKISFNDSNLKYLQNKFNESELIMNYVNDNFYQEQDNTLQILKNNPSVIKLIINQKELDWFFFTQLSKLDYEFQIENLNKDLNADRIILLIENNKIKFNKENYLILQEKLDINSLIEWIKIPVNKEIFFQLINNENINVQNDINYFLFKIELLEYWLKDSKLNNISKTKIIICYFKYRKENNISEKTGLKKLIKEIKKIKELKEFVKIFDNKDFKMNLPNNNNKCEFIIFNSFVQLGLIIYENQHYSIIVNFRWW